MINIKKRFSFKWFLVGAFSFKEKSPTITVASFFFRQTTELIAYVPLFTETDKTTQANGNLVQRVPPFIFYLFYVTYKTGRDQRVPPFNFFFGTVRNFFRKFFKVSKESPLQVFWYFVTECMLMNPKGSTLFIFRHYATFSKFFFKKIFKFYFVPSRETVIFQSYRAWKAHFGCLESVFKAFHEYILGIFRKLWAFWALDIAPTLDVPVLFFFFVRPQSSSRMYHFLQKLIRLLRPSQANGNSVQRVPPFIFLPFLRNLQNRKRPKGPPFQFFFGTVRIFFEIFLMSQKSPCSRV